MNNIFFRRVFLLIFPFLGLLFPLISIFASDDGSISAGGYHTCGIKTDGTVACWGGNDYGQSTPSAGTFTQVNAGRNHTCGIKTDNTVACWGDNDYGKSTPPSGTFSHISAGYHHTCGIKTDNTVACWGDNDYGKSTPPSGTFSHISAAGGHTCGIKTDGTIACWGYNADGRSTPPSGTFSHISAAGGHTCGIKTDGTIACWGYNSDGQSTSPSGIFTQVNAGDGHTCGIKTDGTIACWGYNADGRSTPPSGIFTQLSTGEGHTCGIKTDGTIACWGYNSDGQSIPPTDFFSVPLIFTSASPSDSATGVSINRPIISATFSTPIDENSLSGNIILTSSGLIVPITVVSNSSGTIQIQPDNTLMGDTTYTITYMTGMMSASGVHLSMSKAISFTTEYVPPLQNNTPNIINTCGINVFCPYNVESWSTSWKSIYQQNTTNIQKVDEQNIADPVTLSNGESTYTNTFLKIPSKGLAYELTLTNRSRANYNGPIGHNWDHTYNRFLRVNQNGGVDYYDGKLGVHHFPLSISGSFVSNDILRASLTQTASGYTIAFIDGTVETYGSNMYIATLRDSSNNQLIFNYDIGARLVSVIDGNSNQISYNYHPDGRIMSVSAPGNRSVLFHYDSDANMTSVDILNSGNTRTLNYTYSPQNANPDLSHNLVSFSDAKGQTYVTNVYDSNDRVISQQYGSGTVYYNYLLDGSGTLVMKNTVTNKRGTMTEYLYDTNGNATSITVKGTGGLSDNTYTYTYDVYGKKITETKPLGNGTKYVYNSSGNITEVRLKADMSLADNNSIDLITSYTYDARGNITQIIAPNGKTTNLTYDSANRLIRTDIVVVGGTISNTFSYDSYGRLIEKRDGENNTVQYEYSILHLPTKIKTGSGNEQSIVTYTYDGYGNPLSMTDGENNIKTFTYDVFDRLISQTSAEGVVQEYTYDANNNKTTEKINISSNESVDKNTTYDILDKPTQVSIETKNGTTAIVQYVYDTNGNLIKTTFPNGLIENRTYDMLERLSTKSLIGSSPLGEGIYDANGNHMDYGIYNGTLTNITTYAYDANGNLISENKNGNITSYTYDLYDRLIRTTDALGGYRTLSYDKADNILTNRFYTSTGLLMQETGYTYDILSRLTKMSEKKLENSTYRDTSYTYDKNGNKLTEKNALNYTTTYTYDSLGRQRTKTLPNGLQYENVYDKANNIIAEKDISSSGTITLTHTYDEDNRRLSTQDNLGNTTSYEYNQLGQIVRNTDPSSIDTLYTYDYRGNILTETRAGKTITYEYDIMGNKMRSTDAQNNSIYYVYDQHGNLTQEMRGTQVFYMGYRYIYDANGNLKKKTDPNNTIITHTYDALNRLTRKDISGSQIGGATFEIFSYDALSQLKTTNTSQSWATVFTYDSLSNLTTDKNGPFSYSASAVYDILGRATTRGPSTYTYDNLNRVTSVKTNYITYTYSQRDILSEKLKNNRTKKYVYDSIGRLSTASGSGYISPLTYTYDANSNILSKGANTYTYNNRDELTRTVYVPGTYTTTSGSTYTYDLMGNRLAESNIYNASQTGETLSPLWNYLTGSQNRYTSITAGSGLTYTGVFLSGTILYDSNGNIRGNQLGTQKQYEFKYDYNNRLVQVDRYLTPTTKTTLVTYQYDALGRRMYSKSPTDITYHYYFNDYLNKTTVNVLSGTQLTNEYASTVYYYGANGVDDVVASYQDLNKKIGSTYNFTTTFYYYEKDHLGSIEKISNNSGSVIEEYEYTPFGGTYIKNSLTSNQYLPLKVYTDTLAPTIRNALTGSLWGNTRLYTGREYDRETGLYYMRARHYDPSMGRFIQHDPIGTKDDINLYRYVANSPLVYVDRTGTVKLFLIDYADNVRRYAGYVGMAAAGGVVVVAVAPAAGVTAISAATISATTAGLAGVTVATGWMGLGSAGVESTLTGDKSYVLTEGTSLAISAFGGKILTKAGTLSDAVWNSQTMRYMGHYANGSYGFIKNEVGNIGIATATAVEQFIGWSTTQLFD